MKKSTICIIVGVIVLILIGVYAYYQMQGKKVLAGNKKQKIEDIIYACGKKSPSADNYNANCGSIKNDEATKSRLMSMTDSSLERLYDDIINS